MSRRKSSIAAVALSLALLFGACADDSSPSADDESTQPTERPAEDGEVTVAVTSDGIEMPDELTGGAVEVTLQSGDGVTFSKVTAGTKEDQFKEAIAETVQGGPIPAFIEAQTGVVVNQGGVKSTVILGAGDYIVWAEKPSDEGDESPPTPESILTKPLKVTEGETGELPDTGGNLITARDYTFDVNLTAGAREFQFRNEGPEQFHHVVLFNFGDLEPSVVEQNLEAFLESDADPKPPFDKLNHDELFPGGSGVLSPGQAATARAEIKGGGTYAAVCFINDKAGGPPHAIGKGMRTVFTVE